MGVAVDSQGWFRPTHPWLPNAVAISLSRSPEAAQQYRNVCLRCPLHLSYANIEENIPEKRTPPPTALLPFEQDEPRKSHNAP